VECLVSLTIAVRTIFFGSRQCRVVLNRLWALYSQLDLDDSKDFIDGQPQ